MSQRRGSYACGAATSGFQDYQMVLAPNNVLSANHHCGINQDVDYIHRGGSND